MFSTCRASLVMTFAERGPAPSTSAPDLVELGVVEDFVMLLVDHEPGVASAILVQPRTRVPVHRTEPFSHPRHMEEFRGTPRESKACTAPGGWDSST
eukprot:18929-Rhodomonas_salina.6